MYHKRRAVVGAFRGGPLERERETWYREGLYPRLPSRCEPIFQVLSEIRCPKQQEVCVGFAMTLHRCSDDRKRGRSTECTRRQATRQ